MTFDLRPLFHIFLEERSIQLQCIQKKKLTVDDVFNVHSRWTVFCFKYDRNDGGTASMSAVMFIVVISTGCYTIGVSFIFSYARSNYYQTVLPSVYVLSS